MYKFQVRISKHFTDIYKCLSCKRYFSWSVQFLQCFSFLFFSSLASVGMDMIELCIALRAHVDCLHKFVFWSGKMALFVCKDSFFVQPMWDSSLHKYFSYLTEFSFIVNQHNFVNLYPILVIQKVKSSKCLLFNGFNGFSIQVFCKGHQQMGVLMSFIFYLQVIRIYPYLK